MILFMCYVMFFGHLLAMVALLFMVWRSNTKQFSNIIWWGAAAVLNSISTGLWLGRLVHY